MSKYKHTYLVTNAPANYDYTAYNKEVATVAGYRLIQCDPERRKFQEGRYQSGNYVAVLLGDAHIYVDEDIVAKLRAAATRNDNKSLKIDTKDIEREVRRIFAVLVATFNERVAKLATPLDYSWSGVSADEGKGSGYAPYPYTTTHYIQKKLREAGMKVTDARVRTALKRITSEDGYARTIINGDHYYGVVTQEEQAYLNDKASKANDRPQIVEFFMGRGLLDYDPYERQGGAHDVEFCIDDARKLVEYITALENDLKKLKKGG